MRRWGCFNNDWCGGRRGLYGGRVRKESEDLAARRAREQRLAPEDPRAELAKLDGKTDHFSRKEAERLRRLLGLKEAG